jgi:hypothetical protein
MKKSLLLLFVFAVLMCSNTVIGHEVDQSTPEKVVEAVFNAAKSGDIDHLKGLCDPKGENDGDTKRICQLTEADAAEFMEYFKKGKVNGEAQIDGDKASVPILFGPEGKTKETMIVVKRGDKWYLYSF